jgi:hypothetical protein
LAIHVAASVQLGREPFDGIKAAPREFWMMFERGDRIEPEKVAFKLPRATPVPTVEMRVGRVEAA